MTMWSFERPAVLAMLSLLPFLIYVIHFRAERGGVPRMAFQVWSGEPLGRRLSLARLLAVGSRTLLWLAVVCVLVAAAGPVRLRRERVFLNPGLDLMVVLDESPSMSARDYGQSSRFEAATAVIGDFIRGRENDAIGLVSFSDRAALRVPKTLDYATLTAALQRLEVMTLGDATAIGMGIGVALLHLQGGTPAGKVMVLLTDGENNAGEILPETAAEIAAERGVRIYTIGIGREGDTILEFTDPRTGQTSRGVYRGRFDAALLRRIATITGGRYFAADDPGALAAIFREIDALERTENRTRILVERQPHHRELLLAAVGMLLLMVLLQRGALREVF